MPRRVRIVTPSFLRFDAIGNDIAGMAEVLKRAGFDVRVAARYWSPEHDDLAGPPDLSDPAWDDPATHEIYHFSAAWAEGERLLERARRPVVRFHNVTPPELLEDYSATAAQSGRESLRSIERLCRLANAHFWADSAFNLADLVRFRTPPERCRVLPPLHRAEHLLAAAGGAPAADPGERVLLFAGGIKPHKGHSLLIETLACYRAAIDSRAKLVLAGVCSPDFAIYRVRLERLIRRLDLADCVRLTGAIGEAKLADWYRRADVFVCASRHEGFCMPLVEAMAFGRPIVAVAGGAVAETLGDAGLLFPERDPWVLAEAIRYVLSNEEVRRELADRAQARYRQEFAQSRLEPRFLALVNETLADSSR